MLNQTVDALSGECLRPPIFFFFFFNDPPTPEFSTFPLHDALPIKFFPQKENLLKATPPILIEGKYTSHGKWMDGWETRRRRTLGYDWCIIRLGLPGIVRGVVVDTGHFKGNYPEQCSVEACTFEGTKQERRLLTNRATGWVELLP